MVCGCIMGNVGDKDEECMEYILMLFIKLIKLKPLHVCSHVLISSVFLTFRWMFLKSVNL